jgi:pimeloyl-ACP methyl ester carboxylesterase
MPYVIVRGVELYYEELGDPNGPALLFAHGLMGSIGFQRRIGEGPDALASRGLRVVAYDARGHGRSGYTTSSAHYHWAELAEDMHAFIEKVGVERPAIFGGSMGAGTALMLALNHPESVSRLVLIVPPPFGEDMPPVARTFGGLSVLYQLLGANLTSRLVAALPAFRSAPRDGAAAFDMRRFIGEQRPAAVVPAIRGVLVHQPQLPYDRFGEIEHPALVMTHPDDPIHPLRSGEILHDRMRHARLAVAREYGWWTSHQDELAVMVAAFVRDEPLPGMPPAPHRHAAATGLSHSPGV